MKRNTDGMAKHAIMDPSVTKVNHMLEVLRLVGPWLTWQDWRKLEKLKNKAIREWCHSDGAAISLFELWQEHTESLVEIAHNLWDLKIRYAYKQIPTFVGLFVNDSTDGGNVVRLDPTVEFALYRSSLELSDLEQKIAGNAIHEGSSCVKDDPLPMRGGDRWLHITISDPKWKDSIPPYYFLKRAAPNGLKIVLDGDGESGWMRETIEAVGRAAALRLSGLIVYGSQTVLFQVLKSFHSTLQHEMEGESSSPLEILALHRPPLNFENTDKWHEINRHRHTLINQFLALRLRNLKYLDISDYGPDYFNLDSTEDLVLKFLPHVCPNLQVFEEGYYHRRRNMWNSHSSYLSRISHSSYSSRYSHSSYSSWPDSWQSEPHNVLLKGIEKILKWETVPSVTGTLLTSPDYNDYDEDVEDVEDISTSLRDGLFPSLKVFLCDLCVNGETYIRLFRTKGPDVQGLIDALAIGCPNLRFLQIFLEDLYTCSGAVCHSLLKKLLILVVICDKLEPIIAKSVFPRKCEMRVLTIHCFDIYDIQSGLEGFLNIVDECLPKLEKLNVIYSTSEQSFAMRLKDQFTLKSIDLCIYHRAFPYFKEEIVDHSFDWEPVDDMNDDWYYDEFDGGLMLA